MVWNWAHVHVIINHIPAVSIPIALLTLIIGMVFSNRLMRQWALTGMALSALIAIFAFVSGLGAADLVEDAIAVHPDVIGRHQKAAWFSLVGSVGLGLWSAIGLVSDRRLSRGHLRTFNWTTLAVGTVVTGSLIYTAERGLYVNHPEIRPADEPSLQQPEAPAAAPSLGERGE